MKKLLLTGLAVTAAGMLAACGGGKAEPAATKAAAEDSKAETKKEAAETKEASGDAAELSLWTYPVGKWGDAATVDGIIKKFNEKYPDIKVTVEYLDYQNGDDQINTAIEGKQAPDIVLEGPERLVANWGAKGLMVDLSDMFEKDAASDIYDPVKAACKSPTGAYYEYPAFRVAHCMAINKTMFEKADALQYLDLDTHTWTTENFLKAVQAVYDSGQENVGAIYCSSQAGDQGTRALVNNLYSGTFTDKDHTKYTADSAENIKALKAIVDQAGLNFDPSIAGGDEIKLFRNGTLAMSFCWNAAQQTNSDNGEAGKTNAGDEIIPMLFPSDDAVTELCGGIWGYGIFDNGDEGKITAAKTFIDFVCNDEAAVKESVKASGVFPVRPSVTGVYDGTETADTMKLFEEKFMPSMGDYYQVTKGWTTARTEWWNMLQRIGAGGDVATEVATFTTNANAAAAQ